MGFSGGGYISSAGETIVDVGQEWIKGGLERTGGHLALCQSGMLEPPHLGRRRRGIQPHADHSLVLRDIAGTTDCPTVGPPRNVRIVPGCILKKVMPASPAAVRPSVALGTLLRDKTSPAALRTAGVAPPSVLTHCLARWGTECLGADELEMRSTYNGGGHHPTAYVVLLIT
jgi:hypothetical protein